MVLPWRVSSKRLNLIGHGRAKCTFSKPCVWMLIDFTPNNNKKPLCQPSTLQRLEKMHTRIRTLGKHRQLRACSAIEHFRLSTQPIYLKRRNEWRARPLTHFYYTIRLDTCIDCWTVNVARSIIAHNKTHECTLFQA